MMIAYINFLLNLAQRNKRMNMYRAIFFILSVILVLSSTPLIAQQFTVEPDSLDGVGVREELNQFDAIITNLWDQQNIIPWYVETDIPDDWTLSICQGNLLCWPPWVESDTIRLDAEAYDTLLVKFHTGAEDGVGSTTIYLTTVADPEIQQSYTFTLTVGELSVGDSKKPSADGRSFQFKPNLTNSGSLITLPYSAFGRITMYDMQGRLAGRLWSGHLKAGENYVTPIFSQLPQGQYIMHLSVDGIGTLDQKIMFIR